MSDFETVVAAVDGSDASVDVLRLARLLAGLDRGGRFFAAHAVPPLPPAFEDALVPWSCFGDDLDALRADLVTRASTQLQKRLRDHLPQPVSENLRLAIGHEGDTVLSLAAQLGPTLLVAGSGGRRGRSPGRLGSVASHLLRHLPAPLLLAHHVPADFRLQTIVVGIDLTADSRALLQSVVPIAVRLGAAIQPVYVTPTAEHMDHAHLGTTEAPRPEKGGGGGGGQPDRNKAGGKDPRKVWAQLEETLGLPFSIRDAARELMRKPIFRTGDPALQLLEAAQQAQADLIAVAHCRQGAHDELRLGRVAGHIAAFAPQHVLVVPAATAEAA